MEIKKNNLEAYWQDSSTTIFGVLPEWEIIKFLRYQRRISFQCVLFAALLEIFMFHILTQAGSLSIPRGMYFFKYMIVPFLCGTIPIIIVECIARKSTNLRLLAIATSIMLVVIVDVYCTVHICFQALEICTIIPIMMTIGYGDIILTRITVIATMIIKSLSDLFISWDPGYTIRTNFSTEVMINFLLSLVFIGLSYFVAKFIIKFETAKHDAIKRLEREQSVLYRNSIMDELTKIYNRRGLKNRLEMIKESGNEEKYSLVMMDLDKFKVINDTYGHDVGDDYLVEFASVLFSISSGEAFRYGGDEFCLLLQDRNRKVINRCCRDIRREFEKLEICERLNIDSKIVSFGVAKVTQECSLEDIIKNADIALYHAKKKRGSIVFTENY